MKMQEMSRLELESLQKKLTEQYEEYRVRGLKLNMARGKPSSAQLDLSMPMFDILQDDYKSKSGDDVRNYGVLDGIIEAKELYSEIIGVPAENIIIGGNASLSLMFDTFSRAFMKGVLPGFTPWRKLDKIKFLCPSPGYDRHFAICEYFDIEMIPIEMKADGPDMDTVEKLVAADDTIKGIWCVPMYSNPDGITYSDEVVRRFGELRPAAPDFRIFWDNAYTVHHLDFKTRDHLLNIYDECVKNGNEDMVYIFTSMSKVTFACGGICALAASPANIAHTKKQLSVQTISYDKVNQLRHVRFLKDLAGINAHMARHAEILRPKFTAVLKALEKELTPLGCGHWTEPKGGYFISLHTLPGCAKRVISLCAEAGVILTEAGATYPYGNDPLDDNIRIAPSFPPVEELEVAVDLLCLCVKLAAVDKFLSEK